MDTTTIIRIVAGILAVAVLAFVIYRRKHAKV
jgi:LPXTG-motif cell wall-anchored protein